jgi:hypothetical protein
MKMQRRILIPAVVLCGALQVATAAKLTWNRNLTGDDTAYYSIFDDANWIVEGDHEGTAPSGYTEGIYSLDDVVVPNGITALWEDPATGSGKIRTGKTLAVGTSEPGITRVFVKNNYTSGGLTLHFDYGMTGDPDNNLGAGEWHVKGAGTRALIVKGTKIYSFLHRFGCGDYFEFYGTNLVGICGSGGTSQIRTGGSPDIIAPEIWYGKLQFRDFKGTFTATNTFVTGGLIWRDKTSCRVILSSDNHIIDTFSYNNFRGSTTAGIEMTGGSITMRSWPSNEFTDPASFKMDTATVNLFGSTNDAGIAMAARGRDDGLHGFIANFALGTLVVGDDAGDVVTMQSPSGPYAEGSESTDAALYVDTLDLSSGARLVIPAGIKVYAKALVGSRSNVIGSERLIVPPQGTLFLIR